MLRPQPNPTLFPYTTLFRSQPSQMPVPQPAPQTAGQPPYAPERLRAEDAESSAPYIMGATIANVVFVPGKVDRKSTRLNSSHTVISYAVFCLKKKKRTAITVHIRRLLRLVQVTAGNRVVMVFTIRFACMGYSLIRGVHEPHTMILPVSVPGCV